MIPSAQQARDGKPSEIETLEKTIRTAIENCQTQVYIPSLSDAALKTLKELGYTITPITYTSHQSITEYRISW